MRVLTLNFFGESVIQNSLGSRCMALTVLALVGLQ